MKKAIELLKDTAEKQRDLLRFNQREDPDNWVTASVIDNYIKQLESAIFILGEAVNADKS